MSKQNSTIFDASEFTPAPLRLEGCLRLEHGAEQVFAVVADHEELDRWIPQVKGLWSPIRNSSRRIKMASGSSAP